MSKKSRKQDPGWLTRRAQIFVLLWMYYETGVSREDLVRVFGPSQEETRQVVIEMIQDGTLLTENTEGKLRLSEYPKIS